MVVQEKRIVIYQSLAFGVTFMTYVSIHACRSAWSYGKPSLQQSNKISSSILGKLDFTFLICYSLGSYLLGWLGDKMNLKWYLIISTVGSSSSLIIMTMISFDHFHVIYLYLFQILNGLFQSMAWPGLIAVMGNWIGPDKRGSLMGIWTGCSNVGNIIGLEIGSISIDIYQLQWQWCIFIAAIFQLFMAIIILLLLQPYPQKLNIQIIQIRKSQLDHQSNNQNDQNLQHLSSDNQQEQEQPSKQNQLKFIDYFKIPGVIRYCIGYLGVKSSTYGLLFWLPDYLKNQGVGNQTSTISQVYEVSQYIGGFAIGFICDKYLRGRKSIVIPFCLIICSLSYFMIKYLASSQTIYLYYIFLVIAGINIGAPYNLISSSISADIGKNPKLVNNKSAVSTITSIIEGSGSFGAAVIMIIIPYVKDYLFYLFSGLVFISAIVFIPLAYKDYQYIQFKKQKIIYKEQINVQEKLIDS